MNDTELRKLALDIVEGRVIGTWSMRDNPDLVTQTFPLISMLDEEGMQHVASSAHIYEYLAEAGPWAVNGKPMFLSFKILELADWEPLRHLLIGLEDQRATFLGTTDNT